MSRSPSYLSLKLLMICVHVQIYWRVPSPTQIIDPGLHLVTMNSRSCWAIPIAVKMAVSSPLAGNCTRLKCGWRRSEHSTPSALLFSTAAVEQSGVGAAPFTKLSWDNPQVLSTGEFVSLSRERCSHLSTDYMKLHCVTWSWS